MTEIEELKAQIKVLQKKLSFLEELEKTKSPAEEAFKDWMGVYPPTNPSVDNIFDIRWRAFQMGYNAAQKDYKVGEFQETAQERGERVHKEMEELVRESVKWCEENPDKSVEDYLTPKTPEQTAQSLKEAFVEAQKTEKWKEIQKLIDEEDNDKNFKNSLDLIKEWGEKNKPPTLKELLWEWWEDIFTVDSDLDADASIDVLVDRIEEFLPKEHHTNSYKWNECIKMIKSKLR